MAGSTVTLTSPISSQGPVWVPTGQPPLVGSNQGKVASQHLRWLRPTPKNTSLAEMRTRLKNDGYVFVKNLLPREDVIKVRKDYFQQYAPTGILKPGTSPEEGVFNDAEDAGEHAGIGAGELPPTDLKVKTMTDSHTSPEYLRFLEHTDLRRFVRDLMGWEQEVLLKRTMLRHNAPGGLSTAVHYDKLFLRDGEAYFLTAWVPIGIVLPFPIVCKLKGNQHLLTKTPLSSIGDISPTGGGLIYLSDSAGLGRAIEDDFTRRAADMSPGERKSAFNVNMEKYGQLSQNAADFHERHQESGQRVWLVSGYEAGDVVFHDPYTIHASTMNEDTEGRIRLSTDLRFYREGSDLDERWMKFWTPGDGL